MEIVLGSHSRVVRRFAYRTANVVCRFLNIERTEDINDLQRELRYALDGSSTLDNHECYEIDTLGRIVYLQFSDGYCYVGLGIVESRW